MSDKQYIRDPHSKGLSSKNVTARERIQAERKMVRDKSKRERQLDRRVSDLEQELRELKKILNLKGWDCNESD